MKSANFDLLMNGFTIRSMVPDDIIEVKALVATTPGLALWDWETDENLARSLERNPGLAQVALDWKTRKGRPEIAGAVLIGEGHMSMIHHLAVKPEARGNRLGTHIVRAGLKRLFQMEDAARRVYITTLRDNLGAQLFWSKFGAEKQAHGDLCLFTLNLNDEQHRIWLQD